MTAEPPLCFLEQLNYHHVLQCTLSQLTSSRILRQFWLTYVPLLGEYVPAIRHALTALGAAHRLFLCRDELHLRPSLLHESNLFLLRQYNLAILHIQPIMSNATGVDIQVVLACCLIFVCIEYLRGSYFLAVQHLQAGSRILFSVSRANKQPRLASALLQDKDAFTSLKDDSKGNEMDAIVDIFSRLGSDLSTGLDKVVVSHLDLFGLSAPARMNSDYVAFPSLTVAEEELRSFEIAFEAFYEHITLKKTTESHIDEIDKSLYLILCQRFEKWSCKLDLYEKDRQPSRADDAQERYDFLKFRLLQKTWAVTLKDESRNVAVEDKVEHEDLSAIITRVEELLQAVPPAPHPAFALDSVHLPSLAYAGWLAEDLEILKRVVELFRSIDIREGGWDSRELAEIFEAFLVAKQQHSQLINPNMTTGAVSMLRYLVDLNLPCLRASNPTVTFAKRYLQQLGASTEMY
ncbi:C6 zinc finger domain-containing protein [Colletotrichum truncatum]|uniref:C6 zinc finger domain-containing protein n=1 Tax=Colletotrichum truncatum TaxID=5467 RepID=A0ACC3ZKB7_COLTU|nr:C6 zinc finger domain-containing protein [Colletotrichum truncatum]KAF6799934.1 C6 zinc finger domain-containing protein [Colletotrichum truncatum]